MIEIEMSKDIREFEPKIIGIFTAKQLKWIGIGLAYTLPVVLIFPAGFMEKAILAAVLMAPAIICGWVKMMEMDFDVYFTSVLMPWFLNPKKRLYKSSGRYDELLEAGAAGSRGDKKPKIRYTREFRPRK